MDYFDERISYITDTIFYPTQFVSEAVMAILAIAILGLDPTVVYIITVFRDCTGCIHSHTGRNEPIRR